MSEKLKGLKKWFQLEKIVLHDVEIRQDSAAYSGESLAVYATKDIKEGDTVAVVPKSSLLSVKNSELSDFLESEEIGDLVGGLALVVAVMYERALGKKSKWYDYIQSLPKREYIPLFWSDKEIELLSGTDAQEVVETNKEDTANDYSELVEPLLTKSDLFKDLDMTLDSFQIVASWIGSRAFGVDEEHGMSMVPFADIFNHKASLVSLNPAYEIAHACMEDFNQQTMNIDAEIDDDEDVIEGDDDGEDISVNLPGDDRSSADGTKVPKSVNSTGKKSNEDDAGEEDLGDDEDDEDEGEDEDIGEIEEGVQPIMMTNSRGFITQTELYPEVDFRLHIGICDKDDVLEIVAASDLPKESEIFNTFGELSNSELVTKYGFCLATNPFDFVNIDKEDFEAIAKEVVGKKSFKKRMQYLQEKSALLSPLEEPFEVSAKGQINPPLLIASLLMTVDNEQFEEIEDLYADDAIKILLDLDGENQCGDDEADKHAHSKDCSKSCGNDCGSKNDKKRSNESGEDKEERKKPKLESKAKSKDDEQDDGESIGDETDEEEEEDGGACDLGNTVISDLEEPYVNVSMLKLLKACFQKRLEKYPDVKLDEQKKELEKLSKKVDRSESENARLAALTLVTNEKGILIEAISGVEESLSKLSK